MKLKKLINNIGKFYFSDKEKALWSNGKDFIGGKINTHPGDIFETTPKHEFPISASRVSFKKLCEELDVDYVG